MSNQQSNTLSGFIWRFIDRCGAQGVTFVVSIILARLLDPEAYGSVAIVIVITNIMQVFVDSGFGNALIQKKVADELDFSSVFYFNILSCTVMYLGLFFAAPLLAGFYGDAALTSLIRVMGLSLIISGVRNVQQAYAFRHLLFKKYFFATIGGTVCAAIAGIAMAYAGCGVWALVVQHIVTILVGTIVLWFTVKWHPRRMFSLERLKGLFSYGWKLLVSGLLETGYNEVRQLIIGKLYSTADLALYNKGNQFPSVIVTNVNSSINSVLLPTMSKEQDDRERVKAMTRRAIRTSTYIMAPLMVGLAVCAEPIIRLLLTDKWLACVPFLQIACASYFFYPVQTANLNAIKAMGRSDYFLRLEIIKTAVGLVLVLTTMWISVEALACSLLVNSLLCTVINAIPNKKLLHYSWLEQLKDILPNLALAVVMGVPVFLLNYLPLPTIVVLLLQILTGCAIYVGLSVVLKLEVFRYLLNAVKGFLHKGK